jgi:hypothetical protein
VQPHKIQTIRPSKLQKPDVVALAARFVEPVPGVKPHAPTRQATRAERFTGPSGAASVPNQKMAPTGPMARGKSGVPTNVLMSALVVIALVPSAILFVQLWQDMMRPHSITLPVTAPPTAEPSRSAGLDYPKDGSRFAVEDGDDSPSPVGADASDGAPGRAGGLSFASHQTGALPLSVPAQNAASDLTPTTDGGNGLVLARSEMEVSAVPSPAEAEMAEAVEQSTADIERADQPQTPDAVGIPQRKPTASAGSAPAVRVVKVVTIAPPPPTRPYDGAYGLGSPADAAPAEWMETKTAVDMHAKAEQSSETVKVAQGGIKVRVTARDKNWVQVTDPATSATGWIYNAFLKPADSPAQ